MLKSCIDGNELVRLLMMKVSDPVTLLPNHSNKVVYKVQFKVHDRPYLFNANECNFGTCFDAIKDSRTKTCNSPAK